MLVLETAYARPSAGASIIFKTEVGVEVLIHKTPQTTQDDVAHYRATRKTEKAGDYLGYNAHVRQVRRAQRRTPTLGSGADPMVFLPALLIPLLLLGLFSPAQVGGADAPPDFALATIKAALSGVRISGGGASKLTRSPWGPEMYRNTVDSVVLVFVRGKDSESLVTGSGVMVSTTCDIVTNWHVVDEQKYASVIFRPVPPKTYSDLTKDDIRVARIVKTNQPKDLALLQLERCPAGLKALTLEEPDRIEVGQDVFAIGHPEGLHWTYTEGVISQIRPRYRWEMEDGRKFIATVLQTQTPVSYGSSGGPLINRLGHLVGVISNGIPAQPGFYFAISAHELKVFLGR